jgi:hypothetical protein
MAELVSALSASAAEFIADERNYTNVPSVGHISEVVGCERRRRGAARRVAQTLFPMQSSRDEAKYFIA